jgi:triacylglycerol lipase
MMRYDATRAALLHPEGQATLFCPGQNWSIEGVCAECSRLAYVRFETDDRNKAALAEAIACAGLGEPGFFSDPGTGTQAYTAIDTQGSRAFVVFRGTQPDDPSDIGTDAQAVLVDWQAQGKVHLGFRDALHSVWGPISEWLPGSTGLETWVTGHSLGAALATLAAALLPGSRLVNFGSPRVGNDVFASQFDGRFVKRYVDCCDVVTRLPPAFLGYVHVPGMVYIDRNGKVQPQITEALIDGDTAIARREYLINESWRFGNAGVRDFADHSPVNYVSGALEDRT